MSLKWKLTSVNHKYLNRETIRTRVNDVEGKHAKQSGGRGQYGHVVIDLYPLDPEAQVTNS